MHGTKRSATGCFSFSHHSNDDASDVDDVDGLDDDDADSCAGSGVDSVGFDNTQAGSSSPPFDMEHSDAASVLRDIVAAYFNSDMDRHSAKRLLKRIELSLPDEDRLSSIAKQKQYASVRADIRAFLGSYGHNVTSGRCIACIFHGLRTPSTPISVWEGNLFWKQYRSYPFEKLERRARKLYKEYRRTRKDNHK